VLTLEHVLQIHDAIVVSSGGAGGLRDTNLLETALGRPKQTAFGEELYASSFDKAAALLDSIANNHPFVDGNKRTALATAVAYLRDAMIQIDFTNKEYVTFMLRVVKTKPSIKVISKWLELHQVGEL